MAAGLRFDAREARSLSPGEHIKVTMAPGLRLVATVSTRVWVYRYKNDAGQMRQIKLGNWPAMDLAGALGAWDIRRKERDAGKDPASEKRANAAASRSTSKAERFTVSALRDLYLKKKAGTVKDKTLGEVTRLLHRHIAEIADLPVDKVTRTHAYALLDSMRHTPVVATQLRQALGDMWDLAHDSGRLADTVPNWWRMILRGELRSKGKIIGGQHQGVVLRTLSEDELRLLIPWLPNFTRDIDDALTLGLWTMCRGAEVVKMDRKEIGEEDGVLWWTIPKSKLKTLRNPIAVDHRVPLIGRAEQIVRRRLQASPSDYLFPSRAERGHIQQKALGVAVWVHMPGCQIRPEWQRPRLPVTRWAPHDLRRTGRTMLAEMDCPDRVAETILAHVIPGVEGRYNRHTYDRQKVEWLTRWAERLEALTAPASGR